jgi:succinate-semialdehyde dehydrogenase/glutarate-semialdehyde dehydrogenase
MSSSSSTTLQSFDPYRERPGKAYPVPDPEATQQAVDACAVAQRRWSLRPLGERVAQLKALESVLKEQREPWAECATREMGKPLAQALAEVDKCAWLCRYYAENAERMLEPEQRLPLAQDQRTSDGHVQADADPDTGMAHVRYDPLGLVLAVMPWNFPFWQVFRCAIPAITAGNGVLLKHASNVPGCALACQEAFDRAGFPEGLFQTLLLGSDAVSGLIGQEAVRAVSLTGSEAAGQAVAKAAGQALKPCVLELGGSDPFIVLNDAELDKAVAAAVTARLQNNGQSCIAAKRFIVETGVYDAFVAQLLESLKRIRMGDPMQEGVDLGPLAKASFAVELEQLVQKSMEAGAVLRYRMASPEASKAFFGPVVLEQVGPGMPVFEEEAFGPVFALMRADSPDHALELANAHRYGLGASLWTRDRPKAEAMAAQLETGQVFVNRMVASDPRLPFGGVKRSGYGRELAREGLRAFTNAKTVAFAPENQN